MNAVIFYSATGQSAAVAEYFAKRLGFPIVEIKEAAGKEYENAVLVFPVHCQNLPDAVKDFLKDVNIQNLTAIATYGKMCPGNLLFELKNTFEMNLVAGAYIPTKHSYIEDDTAFCEFERLEPIFAKILSPSPINPPRLYKNPIADLFPKLRSRLGLRICRDSSCTDCGACTEICRFGGIKNGVTNRKCIRCLECVASCPNKALSFKARLPLRIYLRKKKINDTIIYV